MKLHARARLTLVRRQEMVAMVIEQGRSVTEAASAAGVSDRTCSKWVARARAEGPAGLLDRSSEPHHQPTRTPQSRVAAIAALRRLRMTGQQIACVLEMPVSTVSGILTQIGMGKLGRLVQEPVERYERARPGELIHIDIKKLGRITQGAGHRMTGTKHYTGSRTDSDGQRRGKAGWEYCHIAIDDATRLAYAEVLADERASTAIGFLKRALAFFKRYGIHVEELLTDNGSAYTSHMHALACHLMGIRHLRTRPRRPQTNGKAERFIRTMLGGWAYGALYASSTERTAALDGWLYDYNHHRPHRAIGRQPPLTRLNNLLGSYT